MEPGQDQEDLSKKTVVVLALLSCAISVISVFAIVYEISAMRAAPTITEGDAVASGKASFTILDGEQAPPPVKSTGLASFEIRGTG
jgi:hypothetical protein